MKNGIVGLWISACTLLIGCSDSEQSINASKVLSVSDYDYTMNDKQAVSISFGETESNYCSATIYRSSVSVGFKVSSNQNSSKEISMSCNWAGKYYVQSSNHQTASTLEMLSIDPKIKSSEVVVSMKLIDPNSDEYFNLEKTLLVIRGENFDHLIKKM